MNKRKKKEPQLPPSAPLTVRFPVGDLETMRRLAKQNHRSLNAEIVHAISQYISQQAAEPDEREPWEKES